LPVLGQDTIEVSAEWFTYDCQLLNDGPPGVRTVYVRHTFNDGATAVRFMVGLSPGVSMTFLSETHPFPMSVGSTQTGLSVCYGECLLDDVVLATVSYMSYATDQNCSKVLILPHPDAETVEVLACDASPVAANVRDLHVLAPNGVCGCPPTHRFPGSPAAFDCRPLPTATTTWGAVKALYRR
jgi:hypothetical protein